MRAQFGKPKSVIPATELPAFKTDLKPYYSKQPSIIWFGHSSYLIHCDGQNILVDPVLSGNASPIRFQFKAFKGSDIYKVAGMPQIDILILTLDHYDHFDYQPLKVLAPKIKS